MKKHQSQPSVVTERDHRVRAQTQTTQTVGRAFVRPTDRPTARPTKQSHNLKHGSRTDGHPKRGVGRRERARRWRRHERTRDMVRDDGPRPRGGLYNVSNTCYLNSVLQVRDDDDEDGDEDASFRFRFVSCFLSGTTRRLTTPTVFNDDDDGDDDDERASGCAVRSFVRSFVRSIVRSFRSFRFTRAGVATRRQL